MGKKLLAGLATWALMLGMTMPGQATPLTITELSSADVFHLSGSDQEWNTKFPINPGTGRVEFPWGYVIVDRKDAESNSGSLIFERIAITERLEVPLSPPDVSMTITAGSITIGSVLRTIAVGSGLRANIPDNWDDQPRMSSGSLTIIGHDYIQPEIPGRLISLEIPIGSIQLEPGVICVGRLSPVPEPATMLLFGTGLAGLAGARLRKKW